jgi:hypothetical protein
VGTQTLAGRTAQARHGLRAAAAAAAQAGLRENTILQEANIGRMCVMLWSAARCRSGDI